MSKVLGVVIDKGMRMVALIFEGSQSEFGGVGGVKTIRPVELTKCAPLLKNCKNFALSGTSIIPKGKERLCDLKTYNITGAEIDNRVKINKRILDGDTLAGFELEFALGDIKKFSYNDTMRLADWFKPTNFVVRTRDDKKHIAGKGIMLDELPAIQVGNAPTGKARAKNKDTGAKGETDIRKAKQVGETNVDLLTLFETLGENDSLLMSLENYTRTTEKKTSVSKGFRPLSAGVVGSAVLSHSKDDMKSNVKFKKPGMVAVPDLGPVIVYTHNDRTILKNGANHMSRIGVAVHPNHEANVIQYLRAADAFVKIKPIDDPNMELNVKTITGRMDTAYKFYELELNGIQMMSKERALSSVLDVNTVAKMTERVESNGLILKAIKPIIKDLEDKLPKIDANKVLPRFAGYNQETLQKLVENGVNVYTGEYTATIKVEDLDEKEQALIKNEKVEDDAIHIEYSILPNKITKLKAVELWKDTTGGELPYVDAKIAEAKKILETLTDDNAKVIVDVLNKMKAALDDEMQKLRDQLWMHKLAMLVLTDFKAIHSKDKGVWEDTQSKAKGKSVYATKIGSKDILKLAVTDVIKVG